MLIVKNVENTDNITIIKKYPNSSSTLPLEVVTEGYDAFVPTLFISINICNAYIVYMLFYKIKMKSSFKFCFK